ncbi:hypothetical protein [Kribbia dieselivorans]|uniref:hypothetical protein n=1 Tax=Kribbia dieselivorans TaxID=331526 RepID=UPI0012EDE89A|nr:hypothetical protein [Kribbia dieselivorans]
MRTATVVSVSAALTAMMGGSLAPVEAQEGDVESAVVQVILGRYAAINGQPDARLTDSIANTGEEIEVRNELRDQFQGIGHSYRDASVEVMDSVPVAGRPGAWIMSIKVQSTLEAVDGVRTSMEVSERL